VEDVFGRYSESTLFDPDVDASISDQQTRSHLILRRCKAETSQIKQRGQDCSDEQTCRKCSRHLVTIRTVASKKPMNQAGAVFACFARAELNKNAIAVSAEILPASKISTINATIRNAKGAAAMNLSGSEKKESSASRSPIT
jgi:hypothetical protein